MKSKIEILEKLKESIHEVSLGMVALESIRPESRIIGDLGLDSMDYATVMLTVERWSGIKIKEDGVDWSKVQTVDQLADLIMANTPK